MSKLQINPCLEGIAHHWKVDPVETNLEVQPGQLKIWQECRHCKQRVEVWAAGPPDQAMKSFNVKGGRPAKPDTDFGPVTCEICHREFINKGGLGSHRKSKHGVY